MELHSSQHRMAYSERRKKILEAARCLFREQDITGVTMSDIARASGISRQTLYQYFDSIDAVIFTIQEQIIRQIHFKKQPNLQAALLELIDMLYGRYQADPGDFLFVCQFDMYVHLHSVSDSLQNQYRETIHNFLPRLEDILTEEALIKLEDQAGARHYFLVAMHAFMGFVSRIAILGEHYEQDSNVSEQESIELIKRILLHSIKDAEME